jgi:hypothetical protein
VFAAGLASNPDLCGFAHELREHDRLAIQHALLRRLDQQRVSLQLIAAVLLAAAAAVGIDLGVDALGD